MTDCLSEILHLYGVNHRAHCSGEQAVRCPVHDDAHASASVHLGRQVMHCQACGFGGGPVQLVMVMEGIGRDAAERKCEEITGTTPVRMGGRSRTRGRVPGGPGYRPRMFRENAPGLRKRPPFGV